MEQEADRAIEEAFNEGYKQGMLAYAPEVDYWQTRAFLLQEEVSKLKKDRWLWFYNKIAVTLSLLTPVITQALFYFDTITKRS